MEHLDHNFITIFIHYLSEIIPALFVGFLISGIVHEFIPTNWVERYLGQKGIRPIFLSTLVGTMLPICCWGSLPVALSFYKKGSRLGPILAFLVATPATSITALLVTWRLLGFLFTIYICFAVIIMGVVVGSIGNLFKFSPRENEKEVCPHCNEEQENCVHKKKLIQHIKEIIKYAFWQLPKEIGIELVLGIFLAAFVASVVPVGKLINTYLSGGWGYLFAIVFGLIMYICSTATVPLVDAFIQQGMNIGAGMTLLLVGPITSYGTILVLRKEFGIRILTTYLIAISLLSLSFGYLFSH